MQIFNLTDNPKFTTLNYLSVNLKNQINSNPDTLETLNTPDKVNSIAWLQAFLFRKPDTLQTLTCKSCNYTCTDTASNMIAKNILTYHLTHDWTLTKPKTDKSVGSASVSSDILLNDLAEIKDMLKKIMRALDV